MRSSRSFFFFSTTLLIMFLERFAYDVCFDSYFRWGAIVLNISYFLVELWCTFQHDSRDKEYVFISVQFIWKNPVLIPFKQKLQEVSYSGWSLIQQASAIEYKCHSLFYFENKINSSLKKIQNVADPSYDSNCTQVNVRLGFLFYIAAFCSQC